MADQQHPPYPPAPPYPQGPVQGVPPRPAGVPPMGMPPHMPGPGMKIPAGMKMPPRPMGYPMPAGMKMPPRPAGVPPMGMPPAGVAVPPAAPAADALPPVPVPDTGEADVEELWGEESESEQTEAEPVEEQQPEIDENGFIDDLAPDEPEEPEEQPAAEDEEEPLFEASPYEHNMASDLGLPPAFIKTKVLLPLFFLFIICGGVMGFVVGKMQNRSDGEMPGVVYNAEIPKGRPRCGIAQKGQGCVLYLMNAQRREIEAKEFFSMASDVLGVPKFQIETANIRYATMRIPPGYIALLNIPPM
ncbi:MAG: hypothetical protein IJY17_10370 [Alphaproteobacteria bacterium]|nr:hypothetical protein [Alphaproteobacteria bacterium]